MPRREAARDVAGARGEGVGGEVALGAHQVGKGAVQRHAVEAIGEDDAAARVEHAAELEGVEDAEEGGGGVEDRHAGAIGDEHDVGTHGEGGEFGDLARDVLGGAAGFEGGGALADQFGEEGRDERGQVAADGGDAFGIALDQ